MSKVCCTDPIWNSWRRFSQPCRHLGHSTCSSVIISNGHDLTNFIAARKTSTEIGYPHLLEAGLQSYIPKAACTSITPQRYVPLFFTLISARRRSKPSIFALKHIYTDMYLYDDSIRAETEHFASYLDDLLLALRKPLPTENWELVLEVRDCDDDTKDW